MSNNTPCNTTIKSLKEIIRQQKRLITSQKRYIMLLKRKIETEYHLTRCERTISRSNYEKVKIKISRDISSDEDIMSETSSDNDGVIESCRLDLNN